MKLSQFDSPKSLELSLVFFLVGLLFSSQIFSFFGPEFLVISLFLEHVGVYLTECEGCMGIGLDAEIGNRFNESKGRGFLRYLKEGWDTLFYYRSSEYTLVREGETKKVDAYLIAIANSSQYGNNACIAPDASLKDGKFNCVVIQYPGFVGALVLGWQGA